MSGFMMLNCPVVSPRAEDLVLSYQSVRIKFKTSEGICSSARKKQNSRITVAVGPMSSIAVPLIIIPMDIHEQWIEAEAYSSNRNDAIRKNLKVVVSLSCQHLEESSTDFCRNLSSITLFQDFQCVHQVVFDFLSV